VSGPSSVIDFFAIEAAEYLDRIDDLLAGAPEQAPDAEALARTARALRGSASMARQTELADLAGAIEQTAVALRGGAHWSARLADALTAAGDEFRALLRSARAWGAAESDRARRRTAELRALAPAADAGTPQAPRIVPIATLFHADAGPHVVYRAPSPPISADQRFRQAAVPLASTLRRLIVDARRSGDTSDAARQSVGEDLRGALRDLRELAESYGIAPVVNFAAAREGALAQLEPQALDTVDAAAGALIESAGTAWARSTPPGSAPVVHPPAGDAAREAPHPPEPPRPEPPPGQPTATARAAVGPAATPARTPPTGQALVALLQTGISGISQLGGAPMDGDADAADGTELVGIETLLFRGRRALDRAREVRDILRASSAPPDPALLAELYDLLDLATTD
jgi:HPt (histidine-containing phosphotransfer) domain-containing protein